MEKVTFREFFTTVGRGVWQAMKWVAGMFGYGDPSWYGRLVRRIFAGCLAIIAMVVALAAVCAAYEGIRDDYFAEDVTGGLESVRYVGREVYYDEAKCRVVNERTGEEIEDVDWIRMSVDGDSLVCFATAGKRGYFNRFTGEVSIAPEYSRAWIFSEGLCCVEDGDSLIFLNHAGERAFDASFRRSPNADGYVFHGGYCIMAVEDYRYGVINTKGDWVLEPLYDDVRYFGNGLWAVEQSGMYGLYDVLAQEYVLPCEYRFIDVREGEYVVQKQDYSMVRLDSALNVVRSFVYTSLSDLYYGTGTFDGMGDEMQVRAGCKVYEVQPDWDKGARYGLLGADGKPVTKPLYSHIRAIGEDLYSCSQGNYCVTVNGKGECVE